MFSFQVAAVNPLTATSTLILQFPPGTVIPSTISPASIRISDQPTAGPTPPFVFDEMTGTPGLQPASVATDPTNRRITITGPATTAGNTNIYVLIRKDAGIRNPSNPSISNQISINLDNTGSPNDGVATMSEFYAIIPPPIGGATLPPNSIKMGGGYYYSGYFTNYVTNVQVLSPKRLRLWIPAGMQFQQSQPVTITFTDVANLVNTCTAGSYKIRVSTSQEPEAIDSLPYSIVDAVQFTCGEYPKVDPPTISAEGVYDLSFTVGPTGGLNANVDSITVAFPSQTTMPYNMAAGGIYVSTLPITGSDCPPPLPAKPVTFPPTISGSAVTFITPIPIGNGQTVYVKFCKSAAIKNPYTAGNYTLQVKTSSQPTYAVSCPYAIGTAISNVDVKVIPNAACNANAQYEVSFQLGQSGGLSGQNSDYVEIDFAHPFNVNGASVQNDFLNPAQRPSPSSIICSPYVGGYGYGSSTAIMVQALSSKKLRIYLAPGFTTQGGQTMQIIFTPGAGLINNCSPGAYKLYASTSKEVVSSSSKPYEIAYAVIFDPGIPVNVVPPTISKEAQYTIVFRVGPTATLNANTGTITIAFPPGTQVPPPNSMAGGTIWIARNTLFTNNTCPPTHAGVLGVDYAQVTLPPTITGQIVTFTTPITISPGQYVSVRFCKTSGIKNPPTAGAYTLQVKTSTQPAYATSYPYAITSAVSNIKVTPNPNTACSTDVEYKIEFTNSQSGQLSGNVGDYIEVDFNDISNPAPDKASITNYFNQGQTISNLYIRPLPVAIANAFTRHDISFGVGDTGGLSSGDTITIDLPTNMVPIVSGQCYLSDIDYSYYSFHHSADLTLDSVTNPPGHAILANFTTTGTRVIITVPAGLTIPNNGKVYVRFQYGALYNPSTVGSNYVISAFTSKQPQPATSNYFGVTSDRALGPIDNLNEDYPTPSLPPQAIPSTSLSTTNLDVRFSFVGGFVAPNILTIKLPSSFSVPSNISRTAVYLSAGMAAVGGNPFLNMANPPAVPGPGIVYNPDVDPVVVPGPSGTEIRITAPAALLLTPFDTIDVRLTPLANVKNPAVAGSYALSLTASSGAPLPLESETEYLAVVPANNPATSSSISPSAITLSLGASYGYGTGAVNPSSVVVLGPKRVRIYLPLGFTIGQSSTATITFLPSAKLINTCTPGNYIIKLQTSKEPVDIESAVYTIVAAVSNINVRVVPPVVSTKAAYTITFKDTSTTGLKKDRDTVTIAFPTGTQLPASGSVAMGAVYVAKGSDFNNDICPPTHAGTYGLDYAPLNAPPTVLGQQITITVPIDIPPGEFISIRFCESAGITNPNNPGYYTLQVRTSAQPDFAISNPYAIVTGLKRPKVTVEPNVVSRAPVPGCVASTMTITFQNGTTGTLTRGSGRIYITLERDTVTNRGYVSWPMSSIPATSIRVNGVVCTVNASIYVSPTGSKAPRPAPSFAGMVTLEIITPVDITASSSIKVEFLETSGICNPYVAGNYTVAVWTDVETAAVESEPYSIVDGIYIISVDVQPPTVSMAAQYTINFQPFMALTASSSTVTVTFPEDTTVPTTMLPGHIMVDDDSNFGVDPLDPTPPRAALTPVSVSGRSVTFTMPYSFPVGVPAWVRFSLESGIKNPTKANAYRLKMRTSPQPNDVDSPYYYIIDTLGEFTVTVDPPISNYPNAAYTLNFTLSPKGGLTAHVSYIKITFPNNDINGSGGGYATVEAQLPPTIAATNVTINGTTVTETPTVDRINRTINLITPKNIAAGEKMEIVIKPAAGMINPVSGSYRLKLQTSVEPLDVDSAIFSISSSIGGPLLGRNPIVNVSYVVSTLTQPVATGDATLYVDSTQGWVNGAYGIIGSLNSLFTSQIIRLDSTNGVGTGTLLLDALYPVSQPWPIGTPIFMLKTMQASALPLAPAIIPPGTVTFSVLDARPFVGESYILLGPLNATAELLRIAPNGVNIITNTITLASPTILPHPNTDFAFKFANNIGLVNNEAYYSIAFRTGDGGPLTANISTITVTFPFDTTVPSSMLADSVKLSLNGYTSYSATSVATDPQKRSVTITVPFNVSASDTVGIVFMPRAGIRNPSTPGTYRLRISTSSEPTEIDSLAYYMEGTGGPVVSVDPCTKGEVGARYTIKFRITTGLPLGGHIFITFPQDTVLPSVLRQENILINGMRVVGTVTVTTANLTVDLPVPKALLASEEVIIEFSPEARIKNPSSEGTYRLKIRTSQAPDNVDVDSAAYYICPKISMGSVVLIPSSLKLNPNETGTVQVQAKDTNGNNITYNVSYVWSTDIGTLSGTSGDSITLTAPSSPGTGTVTCKATYLGNTLSGACSVTISAPLASVSVDPIGPLSLGYSRTQTFTATAKDTSGNVMSGVNFKWTVSGGVGSISPAAGPTTLLTTTTSAATGSVNVEASFGSVVRNASATVQVLESGGGGGGGGSGGGGSGGSDLTISATIEPLTLIVGQPSPSSVNITIKSLKDLSGGEIRVLIPTGWSQPLQANVTTQLPDGATIGTLQFSGQTIIIPVQTMSVGKTLVVMLLQPQFPQTPGQYVFNVTAKQSTGTPIGASPQPAITINSSSQQSADGSGVCVISPSTASAGSSGARFQITFTARMDLSGGEVQIQVPLDWTPPTDSPGNKGQVILKNTEGEISAIQFIAGGTISVLLGKLLANQKFTLEYANVDVPATEKKYTFNVLTAGKGGRPRNINNPPTIEVVKTSISNLTCAPKPNSAGGTAQYQISFRTSESGTLIKDLGTISLQFQSDTSLPATISAADIKVQGVPLIAPPQINQSTRTIVLTCPTDVPPNQTCVIIIEASAGVKNPTQPKSYRLTAWTSSDASPVISNAYDIQASTVSPAKVTPDPVVVAVDAQYTITFKTGGSGRLSIGEDQIVIKFPNDTVIPPNINATAVTINGKPLTKRPNADNVSKKISLYVPEPIPENGNVTIIFDKSAQIKNPTKAGNYTLFVSTTKETIEVESEAYGIGSSSITNPKVTPASNNAGSTCIDYTIEFQTGQFGALSPASTITIAFHPNYKLGSIEARRITVNGMGVVETPEVRQGQYITFKVPGQINALTNVKVVIQCLDNPTTAGSYFVKVYTSAEPTQIQSNQYSLGETLSTTLTLAPPNPNGDNGWYNTKPSIILSCNVPAARTYYKVDDQAQQLYTGAPVQLTDGTHIVEYWSEAAGYDSEVHQTIKNIKVDTVRPTLTVTKPKEGDVVPEAIIEIQGTYVEDNILQVTCAVGIGANPVTLVIDKVAKTFSGKVMLTKGQNILDIKAIDEAGNTSLSPAVNVTYDPDRTCTLQLIILNPKDNSQPTYGVQLVNESQIDYHHIELKTNIQGTSSCDLSKVEVSSEGDATKWVQVPYDPIKKNFNGDVSLKAKAGNCKITIKVTDKNGKTETIVRTLVCQVKIEFIGIKSYHTINDAKKPIPSPTKSLHNGSAITNLSSYPFISQAGRTLAPFRFVGNAFGATVDYDPIRKAATYKFEGKTVELMLGSNTATIIEGGQRRTVPLDPQNASVRAEVVGDRTYVPIRFFESIFGWKPVYTAATRTVTITFP